MNYLNCMTKMSNMLKSDALFKVLCLCSLQHYPLAQLMRSKQTCSYKFDNEQKHMTTGACTEDHLLVPFSYK